MSMGKCASKEDNGGFSAVLYKDNHDEEATPEHDYNCDNSTNTWNSAHVNISNAPNNRNDELIGNIYSMRPSGNFSHIMIRNDNDTSFESTEEQIIVPACFSRSYTPSIPEDVSSIPESDPIDRHFRTIKEEDDDASAKILPSSSSVGDVDCNSSMSFSSASSASHYSADHARKRYLSKIRRIRNERSRKRGGRRQKKTKNRDDAVNSSIIYDFVEMQKLIQRQKRIKKNKQKNKADEEIKMYDNLLQNVNEIETNLKESPTSPEALPFFSDNTSWFFDFIKMDEEEQGTLKRNLMKRETESRTRQLSASSASISNKSDNSSLQSQNYSVQRRRRHSDIQQFEGLDVRSNDIVMSMLTPNSQLKPEISYVPANCHSNKTHRETFGQLTTDNANENNMSPAQLLLQSRRDIPKPNNSSPVISIIDSLERISKSPCRNRKKAPDQLLGNADNSGEQNRGARSVDHRAYSIQRSSADSEINYDDHLNVLHEECIRHFASACVLSKDESCISSHSRSDQSPSSVFEDIHILTTPVHANCRKSHSHGFNSKVPERREKQQYVKNFGDID